MVVGFFMARGMRVPSAIQPGQWQGERVYVISESGSLEHDQSNRSRAIDPATREVVWSVTNSHPINHAEAWPIFSASGDMDGKGYLKLARSRLVDASRAAIATVLSPDGSRLYVADPSGITAIDTQDGTEL
ncbi:MAG TPA: hypothetical protein VD886_08345 [Herpetosiphonaceae bacterium]|nr:hypothetical protein [Herpetosiphonaceae bacterium]